MNEVGQRRPRFDAVAKVTGRAVYAGDLHLPGMLSAVLVRSPHPHALIRGIDAAAALALPGVHAVLTAADIDPERALFGHAIRDKPILAADRVRHVGEAVAAVAAEDEETARRAAELVQVDYEVLPAATTLEEALAADAPVVHERGCGEGRFHDVRFGERSQPNVCFEFHEEQGDVDAAFAAADVVVEDTYTFPMVFQFFLEPHVLAASADAEGITVWAAAQHPYLVRAELSNLFRLPLHKIRVVAPYVGGGFGGKSYTLLEPIVVALALKARRPVLLACSMEEAFLTTCRHPARVQLRTAARRDGTLLAREAVVDLDTGAYADNGPRVAVRAAIRVFGPYRLGAYRTTCRAIYTHSVPAGSYRAIGGPQAVWAGESQLDDLAARLGIPPLELRRRNLAARGERFRGRRRAMDADLAGDLRRLTAAAGDAPGLSLATAGGGAGPVATALLRLHADGSATLLVSSVEIGQGARTVLAQIAAEVLGTSADRIEVPDPDTDASPYDRSTGASRSTTVMGTAVQAAAEHVRRQLLETAAETLGDGLTLQDGCVVAPDGRGLTFAEVLAARYGMPGGELIGRGYSAPHLNGGRLDDEPVFWEIGMGAADVEVDEDTGAVRVTRYTALTDIGRAINPLLCEGQEEGAAVQGLGHTLFEEVNAAGGQLLNANAVDYRVPLCEDLPDTFAGVMVENQDGPGPFGAKGAGEGGIVPVAAAVGNAVFARTGARLRELPLTPERVWRALQGRQAPPTR